MAVGKRKEGRAPFLPLGKGGEEKKKKDFEGKKRRGPSHLF